MSRLVCRFCGALANRSAAASHRFLPDGTCCRLSLYYKLIRRPRALGRSRHSVRAAGVDGPDRPQKNLEWKMVNLFLKCVNLFPVFALFHERNEGGKGGCVSAFALWFC